MPHHTHDSPHRAILDDIALGLSRASVLQAALELNVFTHIANGYTSAPALCRQTGATERGMRVLLEALMALGLVQQHLTEFALAPTAKSFLVKGQFSYLGDAILADFAWDARGRLSQTIRGKRVEPTPRKLSRVDIVASHRIDWKARLQFANALWQKLGFTPAKAKNLRVLDVNCGAGILAFALARRNPSVRITAVDHADVLRYTKQIAKAMNVASQVKTVAGDALTFKFKAGSFDVVIFDDVTNNFSVEQNAEIFHRAFHALAPNGWIVVRTPLPDDNRKKDLRRAFAGIETLLFSAAGDTHSFVEYRGMLEIAGFFQVINHQDAWGLITARKILSERN
jgi:2-polyprenyl-3-methyl-5-hydroxy-6-metoxy-1,4-benzoquinol methylase